MSENLQSPHQDNRPRPSNQDRQFQSLTALDNQQPWILSFFAGIKDYFFPEKQPPLAVTSRPLTAKEMVRGALIVAPEPDTGSGTLGSRFQPGVALDSDHLSRLASTGVEASGIGMFLQNIRDLVAPPKQPPLQVTSKPVQVKNIWGFSAGYSRNATMVTVGFHAGVVALMFLAGFNFVEEQNKMEVVDLTAPIDIAPYVPRIKPEPEQMGGGGGGGDRSPLPASKGQLPELSYRQFVPPQQVISNPTPKLVMQPTIVVPPDTPMPQVNMNVWGDPLAKIGPPSNGTGSGGGIGDGSKKKKKQKEWQRRKITKK
jgi:phage terminase large subunit-like protein